MSAQVITGFRIGRDVIEPIDPEAKAYVQANIINGWSYYPLEGVLRRHTDEEVAAGKAFIIGAPTIEVDMRRGTVERRLNEEAE